MKGYRWLVWMAMMPVLAGAAWAQGPGGPGGPGGGMSPEARQRMEQFRKFREQHEHTYRLSGTLGAIAEMEKGGRCPLTPDQAKKIVVIVEGVKKKPKLTQDEAKAADKSLRAVLSVKQLNEVSRLTKQMEERRSQWGKQGGGPGGGGPGGPGGAGAPRPGAPGTGAPGAGGSKSGKRPPFDPKAMKDFNPFAAPKADDTRGQQRYKRVQEGIDLLQKKAKQKK